MQSPNEPKKRAAAVIRVSKVGKREADKFISPEDQLKQINAMAEQHAWDIVAIYHEFDQSGLRTKFEKRKGLYPAARMVENGQADVVAMAFFDRMARNIVVQTEFLGRVGRAGGEVWAHDWGRIATDTAATFLTTGMMGLFTMYTALSVAEKTQGPKERAIARGIPTFPHIPAGYRLEERRLVVYEPEAKLIREAFDMRDQGKSYHTIRDWLRSQGLMRSTRGVQELLMNRIYLGELRFGRPKAKGGSGELVNVDSHPAIIRRDVFERVIARRKLLGVRGERESKYGGLLTRQQILRCGSCDRAMIVGATPSHGRTHIVYRCPTIGDCRQRVSVTAHRVDSYVSEWMKQAQVNGSYSADEQIVQAEATLGAAQADLKQAMRNLATFKNTEEARTILEEYRQVVVNAQAELDRLRRAFGPSAVTSMGDWDKLSLEGRRDLVRALIKRIRVHPGRGAIEQRLTIEAFEE